MMYPIRYTTGTAAEVRATEAFRNWMNRLRDIGAKARIQARIDRLAGGNSGDCVSVGSGVLELRVHVGAGYRVYFTWARARIVVLLAGGDKQSQPEDILRAKSLARSLPDGLQE